MKVKSVQSFYPSQSVIQTILNAHGGELKVETLPAEAAAQAGKEDEGSTFII